MEARGPLSRLRPEKKREMIVLHEDVDLDACLCAAAHPGEVIRLLPADAESLPPHMAGAIVLDHPLGLKGRVDEQGRVHAVALEVCPAGEWDPDLLAEVDEQTSTGRVVTPRFSLADIMAGLRAEDIVQGWHMSGNLDACVVATMVEILRGLNHVYRIRLAAQGREVKK